MKLQLATAAVALALAGGAALAHGTAQPRHGGTVQTANDLNFELVASADGVAIHIDDHGKPVPAAGFGGRLTLLAGGRTTQAELRAEGDRLLARGVQLDRGARVVAVIRDAQGRPITVRFVVP